MKPYIIGGLIGAVLLFVILKLINKKPKDESKVLDDLLKLSKTDQAKKLVGTDEFSELMKTDEFRKMAADLGVEILANLINVT